MSEGVDPDRGANPYAAVNVLYSNAEDDANAAEFVLPEDEP